jgi:glycosylphosphatidylinositol transamidase (GPIT) subunit GPI8/ABC-type branched-subunit amino acid transport system substrate-binding protein
MRRTNRIISLAVSLVLVGLLLGLPGCKAPPAGPFKIGVLLPLSGPDSLQSREVLDWAAGGFNRSGGTGGAPVELVYKDTYNQDISALAGELLKDNAISIVIGPQKSRDVHTVAPLFIESRKLLISPMATSSDILRAYGGKDFIWRTCQSDVAQVRSILYELSTRGVTRVSLIYTEDGYGRTFLEWAGFFCTELGIDLLHNVAYGPAAVAGEVLEQAMAGEPEYIVTAVYPEQAVALKRLMDGKATGTKLFFTDAAEAPYVIEQLGAVAEGLESMSPAADPDSGFEAAYQAEFGYYPWDYAAPTYDAFLLAVYTLARQEAQRNFQPEARDVSLRKVVSGTGIELKWDQSGQAAKLILEGELPDVTGASGPLRFDKVSGVDPVESFYSLNRVETVEGVTDFRTIRRFSSSESAGVGLLGEDTSAVSTRASARHLALTETGTVYQPGERNNLRAVIVSTSDGWSNYRHQSDALAVYNRLKENGVSDDDIILFSIDDVPWLSENPLPGDIHHEVKGDNLRQAAEIDYSGDQVTVANLANVLLGKQSAGTPVVLQSDAVSDVLIYIVGHGMPGAISFKYGEQLTADHLSQLVDEMYSRKRYRQTFVLLETCYGESLVLDMDAPGAVCLTGASRIEASFGATYDPDIKQWLADDFTRQALAVMAQPHLSLEELYLETYNGVISSHVRLVNYANFGDLETPVSDFIAP